MKETRPRQNSRQRGNPLLEKEDLVVTNAERRTDAVQALRIMKRLEAEKLPEMVSVRIPGQGNTLMLATRARAAAICDSIEGAYIDQAATVAPAGKPRKKNSKTKTKPKTE